MPKLPVAMGRMGDDRMRIEYIPTGAGEQAREVLIALGRACGWNIGDVQEDSLREVAAIARHSRSMREDGFQESREVMR